jgi:SAM-dependent MidA family methyltransferase
MAPTDLQLEILREISASGGAIPFRRFMELALYHPDHGYYASGRAMVGKDGDFFTSVSVGSIYGRLLASVCREVWERLEKPSRFTIVEQGANDGSMARDMLQEIHEREDSFAKAVQFVIVEPFPANQAKQSEKLLFSPKITWVPSVEELQPFTGIHLSNELLDAFPVDSLRWSGTAWEEECVESGEGELIRCARPIADPELHLAAGRLPTNLSPGFRLEVNRGIPFWLSCLHAKLERGIVLTIDYGQAGEDRHAPHRADGTLLAFKNHERFNDPLPEPGDRDITAQVDFTALARDARDIGFEIIGYSDQHHFLVGTAEPWLRSLGDFTERGEEARQDLGALQTLLNPGSMGMQFKAIALGKGFPVTPPLSCFKYQRPGPGVL